MTSPGQSSTSVIGTSANFIGRLDEHERTNGKVLRMGITITKVKANHRCYYYCHCCGEQATYELKVGRQTGGTTILIFFCETHLGQLNTKVVRAQARKV